MKVNSIKSQKVYIFMIYTVNFKIYIIYDFKVSFLKSYISGMVGPIFSLKKCSSFNSKYIPSTE